VRPGKQIFALVLIAVIAGDAYAQDGFTKSLKPSGWKVPNVAGLKVLDEKSIAVDGYRVKQISYKLPDPAPFTFSRPNTKCEFKSISTYVAAGEVFAIGGDCVQFGTDPRHGKFYFGGKGNFSFFDEDGDGKFETLIRSGFPMVFLPERLRRPADLIFREPPPPAKKPG